MDTLDSSGKSIKENDIVKIQYNSNEYFFGKIVSIDVDHNKKEGIYTGRTINILPYKDGVCGVAVSA